MIRLDLNKKLSNFQDGPAVVKHQSYMPPPRIRDAPSLYTHIKETKKQIEDIQKPTYAEEIVEVLKENPNITLGQALVKTGKQDVVGLMQLSQYTPDFIMNKLPEDAREFSRLRNSTAMDLLNDPWFMENYGDDIMSAIMEESGVGEAISEGVGQMFEKGKEKLGNLVTGFTDLLSPKPAVNNKQVGGKAQDVEKLGELKSPTNTDAQNFPKRGIPEDININPDLLYFNPGQSFFENNPEEGLDRQRDWLTTYIQSPMYLERLSKEFPNYSQSELEAERDARLNNVLTTKIRYPDEPLGGSFGYTAGLYYMKEAPENVMVRTSEGMVPQTGSGSSRGRIELEPEYRPEGMPRIAGAFQYPYPGFELIPLHELGHSVDDGGTRIPATTRNLVYENVIAPNQYNVNESYPEDNQEFTYVGSPSEFVNRLLPFRYELQRLNIVDPNTQQITESDIKKYLELTNFKGGSFKNSQVEDLFNNVQGEGNTEQERLDDQIKRITFMLNNIAMNESQEMFYGKQGGKIQLDLEKRLGVDIDQLDPLPIGTSYKSRRFFQENPLAAIAYGKNPFRKAGSPPR